MQDKLLQKPPPKYIYDIIINTMNATEFPKGLFTDDELNPKYFDESPQNKIEILQKAIDITKIVNNDNFEIKPKNILKGEEPDKTNYFLQAFHKAATSGKDFPKYIKKYIDHRKKKEEEKKNKEKQEEKKEPPKEPVREQPKQQVPDKKQSTKETVEIKEQKTQNEERKTVKKKKIEEPPKEEQPKPSVVVETKPQRVASALKRPEKVKENVEEINDNTNQNASKPVGIISDKNKEEDEEGEKPVEERERNEENVQSQNKGIKFDTKLRPGGIKDQTNTKSRVTVNVTDLESIKNYVQEISRNANPIGKIIDFLPDDIESMNKELASWIKEQKILKDKYDEEVKKSEEILQPLHNELLELEESVKDEIIKIHSIKYRIIKNEQLITDLVNGVISIKNK